MKASARVRSASQSVQPEESAPTKRATPASKAKKQIEVIDEALSDEEEAVEKPKKKVAEKSAAKVKDTKPVAPRVTVRKVGPLLGRSCDHRLIYTGNTN